MACGWIHNRAFPYTKVVQAIYAEKVQFMQVNWGDFPRDSVDEAHRSGVKVLHQVGSVEAAIKAAEAGVDAIIVQGVEAGGHVLGQASSQSTTYILLYNYPAQELHRPMLRRYFHRPMLRRYSLSPLSLLCMMFS